MVIDDADDMRIFHPFSGLKVFAVVHEDHVFTGGIFQNLRNRNAGIFQDISRFIIDFSQHSRLRVVAQLSQQVRINVCSLLTLLLKNRVNFQHI